MTDLPPMCPETYRRAAALLSQRWGMSTSAALTDSRERASVRTRWRLWATMKSAGWSGNSIAMASGYDPTTVNGKGPSGTWTDPSDVYALCVAMQAVDDTKQRKLQQALEDVEQAMQHLAVLRDRLSTIVLETTP